MKFYYLINSSYSDSPNNIFRDAPPYLWFNQGSHIAVSFRIFLFPLSLE